MIMKWLLVSDYDSVVKFCFENQLEMQYIKADLEYYIKTNNSNIKILGLFCTLFEIIPSTRFFFSDIVLRIFYQHNANKSINNTYLTLKNKNLLPFEVSLNIANLLGYKITHRNDTLLNRKVNYFVLDF